MRSRAQARTAALGGRVALVTGSVGQGIGRSIALYLAAAGADVALNFGTRPEEQGGEQDAARVRAAIEHLGRRCAIVRADVRNADQVAWLFAATREQLGEVDVLVNNAGAAWLEEDLSEISTERWEQTVAAELHGAFYCIREALPAMRRKRWGRIVNVVVDFTSLDLLVNTQHGHVLDRYPYPFAVGKLGRQMLARHLAYAELKNGITINNVLPGIIEHMSLEEAVREAAEGPGERAGARPSDVAEVIAFLCRDEALFITNSDIVIPGNLYSRLF